MNKDLREEWMGILDQLARGIVNGQTLGDREPNAQILVLLHY